jgi:hypothetical protein
MYFLGACPSISEPVKGIRAKLQRKLVEGDINKAVNLRKGDCFFIGVVGEN